MEEIHPTRTVSRPVASYNEKAGGSEDKSAYDNKASNDASSADRIDVIAPTLPHSGAPNEPNEKGEVIPAEVQLHRRLKSRHIAFVGLGSGIGVGVFVGIGSSLAGSGPGGLLLAYIITGMVIWTVIQCIGEIATLFPVAGNFPHFASRFIDPAMGLALGWNYWWNYALSLAAELAAASVIISYWSDLNPAIWITVCFIPIIALNYMPVNFYGEAEVVACSIKVVALVGLLILGLIIDLGGAPSGDRIGFRYWKDPGAFVQYAGIAGGLGRFLSFFTGFINAGYSYSGTEVVVLTASEASNPTKQIPKASKRVLYRICLFNIGSALIVGMLVPYTNEALAGGSGNAASSPWVIAIQTAGIKALPSIVNAVILTSAWSAGNSFVYVSSRTLVGLAMGGHAPKVFLRTSKKGVPYWSVTFTLIMGALAYLSCGAGGATQAFSWFQSMCSLAGILAWGVLCVAYIRMHAGLKAQGIDRDSLPWKSALQPYGAWFGAIVSFIIVIFSGFTVFIKDNWTVSGFFANYISLAIFVVPFVFFKFWWKTKFVRASEMDLWSGRLDPSEEEPEKEPTTWGGKLLDKLF